MEDLQVVVAEDTFEVVEHGAVPPGEYGMRLRAHPYEGVVIRLIDYKFAAPDSETGLCRMDFDYDIIDADGRDPDILEKDEGFATLVSGIILNLILKCKDEDGKVMPQEVADSEEIAFAIIDPEPHGEVSE